MQGIIKFKNGNDVVIFMEEKGRIAEFVASIDGIGYSSPEDLVPVLLFVQKIDPQEKFYELLSKMDDLWINPIKEKLLSEGVNI